MKKAIALLLALVMCFALCACGGSSAPAAPAQPSSGSEPAPAAPTGGDTPAAPQEPVDDTVYNLVVVNHDATTSMCELYIETLCGMMTEASNGRLQFTFYPGGSLLGATETMDGVKDGSADMCWSCSSFFGGRFPVSEFINLVGTGIDSAREATEVFNTMWEEVPELQEEFKDWKMVALHACTFAPFSTVGKKVETQEDFGGLQIRAAGTVASKYVEALGATPITMPTGDVYEAVEKGVIDGFANDWHNIDCFKLYEPIDYCLNLPINFTSCWVAMSWDAYNKLPADLQAVVDEFAGGYAGAMAGYWWDSCRYWVADKMVENGVEIVEPSAELKEWATSPELVQGLQDWYVTYLNDAGHDGQALFDQCMAIVASVSDKYDGAWDAPFNYADWAYTPDNWDFQ